MFKRILLSLMTLLVLYSGIVVAYLAFSPEMTEDTNVVMENPLDYDSLKDYTLASGVSSIHYYFFGSPQNSDSIYIGNTILKEAQIRTGLDLSRLIEFVDISGLENTLSTNRLKNDWGINSYPAFAKVYIENGEIVISNVLEWDPNQPLSTDDICAWLQRNDLNPKK